MNNLIKWAHLSDFHFGKNEVEQKFTAQKVLEHFSERHSQGVTPDFIFVTGDVANSGKKAEFDAFSEQIIFPLVDLFGSDFLEKILVVPGNHDLDRSKNDAFSKEKFAKTDGDYFYPTADGKKRREMIAARFSSFCESLPCNGVQDFLSENGAFFVQHKLRQHTVAIVGLNTAWLSDGERDEEALTPGLAITRAAVEKMAGADLKFVLGHHPMEWFHQSHRPTLQTIFAEHQIIYLHGHMHAENFSNLLNGAGEFVTIQAGATWQAPEGGKWRNGFMWGEFDGNKSKIALQPYFWSFPNQCWTLDGSRFHENYRNGDWWEFSAPKKRARPDFTPKKKNSPLIGWEVKDFKSLEQCEVELDAADAIAYFDGATPGWMTALSQSIPRREIVEKIVGNYKVLPDSPIVCVLLAAGCEGKSTALLQASFEILRGDRGKKILFRTNHTRDFSVLDLEETLRSHDNWLVVIDEADQVAVDVLRFIETGLVDYDGRIDFALASRDSDWNASGSNRLAWGFRSKFKEITLKDLSFKDAELIVQAWGKFGKEALGEELVDLPVEERSEKLRFYAKKEAKGNSDAFFGALLMCRHGGDLLFHAEAMLQKLSTVELDCGKSLKDVLGYIAAMHAEGFNKLTFSALAELTDMSVSKLQNEVIRQLGKEAAATSTSTTVFTRHRYIALALVEVLETKFNEDISNYYIDLALSEAARSKRENVFDLAFWRYEMSEKLFSSGKERLAIEIAERLYEADDLNFFLLTKLASFYRRYGNPGAAVKLFRRFTDQPRHRGFYFEWGVCEGNQRNFLENALLALYALSDDSENMSLTVEQVKIFVTGLSKCFDQLHISFADPIFRNAEDACNSILQMLSNAGVIKVAETAVDLGLFVKDVNKKRRKLYGRAEALNVLKQASLQLGVYGVSKDVLDKIDLKAVTFMFLDTIVRNVEGRPKS